MTSAKSKLKVFNRDTMKYLAYIPMFTGHMIAWLNYMNNPGNDLYDLPLPLVILSGLSLFCPPVMFFFIADGYKYTRNRKKYALRLLLFACITQPFHWLIFQPLHGWWSFNVIFTLFFGLLAIIAWESKFRLWLRILLVILCTGATVLIFSDWMIFGVLLILSLHIFREKPKARFISYSILILIHTLLNLTSLGTVSTFKLIIFMAVMLVVFLLAYLCMTAFYNGEKGRHPVFAKWFFYVFYPLHYLIIFLVQTVMERL